MSPVGLGLTLVGYTLAYFGFCSLRGPGVGLLDLVIPGRTVTIPSASSSAGGAPGSNPFAPGQGAGGSTLIPNPTNPMNPPAAIIPGPGVNSPQPGGYLR